MTSGDCEHDQHTNAVLAGDFQLVALKIISTFLLLRKDRDVGFRTGSWTFLGKPITKTQATHAP